MSYTYPLSQALSEYMAIQPDTTKIEANVLLAFAKLDPNERARITPLLQAGVPAAKALSLAKSDTLAYRLVLALLAKDPPVALVTIEANLASISTYDVQKKELPLSAVETGASFDEAKTLADRLKG